MYTALIDYRSHLSLDNLLLFLLSGMLSRMLAYN
jgi:hypothetical protein